jgi:hypothetical protein
MIDQGSSPIRFDRTSSSFRGTLPNLWLVSIACLTSLNETPVSMACRMAVAGVTMRIPSCQLKSESSSFSEWTA